MQARSSLLSTDPRVHLSTGPLQRPDGCCDRHQTRASCACDGDCDGEPRDDGRTRVRVKMFICQLSKYSYGIVKAHLHHTSCMFARSWQCLHNQRRVDCAAARVESYCLAFVVSYYWQPRMNSHLVDKWIPKGAATTARCGTN